MQKNPKLIVQIHFLFESGLFLTTHPNGFLQKIHGDYLICTLFRVDFGITILSKQFLPIKKSMASFSFL